MISNILRALGDSQPPSVFLIFSSILNIILDIIFIVPLNMGAAGAAWATVLSQLLSALLCTCFGMKKFPVLRITHNDFGISKSVWNTHVKTGFPMGFQMSVMCIGQFAMQGAVNTLRANVIAGYTAAAKVDQASVLVHFALGIAGQNNSPMPKAHASGLSVCVGFWPSLMDGSCFPRIHVCVLIQFMGNVTIISKDFSSCVVAPIFPLCAETIADAIESPSPYPPVFEFLDGSAR